MESRFSKKPLARQHKERTDEIELGLAVGAPDVRLEAVRKSFGDVVAVDGVDLQIPAGEFFTLLGPVRLRQVWIFQNFARPNQIPIINVVAVIVILLSMIPVYIASRLTQESGIIRGRR
jgi:hypothetical protein